jgi:molybdopterin-guanine dinucleotide biosynthesis protein A
MREAHNSLILAAGENTFLTDTGERISKFDFAVSGESLVSRIVSTYQSGNTRLLVSEDGSESIQKSDGVSLVKVGRTQGALISALIGLNECDLSIPLFIAPGDALVSPARYSDFRNKCLSSENDFSIVVFDSDNPNYSYIRTREGKLVEVCEKKVISSQATAGIFYFKSAQLFLECAEWSIMNNFRTRELFFLAPALNYFVVTGLRMNLFQIEESEYYRFSQEKEAIESEKRYKNANQ